MKDEGIAVPEELKFSKYRATFDIEVYYPHGANLPDKGEKLEFTQEHHLLSVSVASNVHDFQAPKCFVVKEDEKKKECIEEFIHYLQDIASKAQELELARYADLLRSIEETLCSPPSQPSHEEKEEEMGESTGYDDDTEEEEDEDFIDDEEKEEEEDLSWYRRIDKEREDDDQEMPKVEEKEPPTTSRRKIHLLLSQLEEYISELIVVGFNSGKYDLNVLKDILIPHLVHTKGIRFTAKRGHAYLVLKTGSLKFLDIANFLAPGTSYAGFLKAYDCAEEKGFFPYEYMDSLERLNETHLPPREAFNSWLKKQKMKEEEYAICEKIWKDNNMKTLLDFLIWYNNRDVVPFLEALEKMCQFWRTKGIDMLKEVISLPALAFKFEMSFLKEQGLHLSGFQTKELYDLFHKNMVGGPAIIFHRYAEANKTTIRGNPQKPVKSIIGYDANALYLWALTQPMPVGLYTHWNLSQHQLIPDKSWRMADEWLAWVGFTQGVTLRTRLNNTEKRLGDRQFRVDGYDAVNNTVYEFLGCYWHGCPSCYKRGDEMNHTLKKTHGDVLEETRLRSKYLESLPNVSRLVQCWECEWLDRKKGTEAQSIESFLNNHFPGRNEKKNPSIIHPPTSARRILLWGGGSGYSRPRGQERLF